MPSAYTTTQGDMWDLIAKKVYGTELALNVLLAANLKHINTVVFSGGVVLNLPTYSAPKSSTLPPWRR